MQICWTRLPCVRFMYNFQESLKHFWGIQMRKEPSEESVGCSVDI